MERVRIFPKLQEYNFQSEIMDNIVVMAKATNIRVLGCPFQRQKQQPKNRVFTKTLPVKPKTWMSVFGCKQHKTVSEY